MKKVLTIAIAALVAFAFSASAMAPDKCTQVTGKEKKEQCVNQKVGANKGCCEKQEKECGKKLDLNGKKLDRPAKPSPKDKDKDSKINPQIKKCDKEELGKKPAK